MTRRLIKYADTILHGFNRQSLIFSIAILIFCVAAFIGWQKLHYGFNFTDEGYHMTEAWRLTVGDHFFQEKARGAIDLSPIINSLIFRINPDITLLGFRKIQYILTICALLLFSLALYKTTKLYWYQPLIFSIFAFTGLDLVYSIPNLNYHTYPHLFITLHLAFLLLAFRQESAALRRTCFIIAGIFLWLISFTLLHLSLILFSPVILFYFFRKWKTSYLSFDFTDLCFVSAPILFCWSIFVAFNYDKYIPNILANIALMSSTNMHSNKFFVHNLINWESVNHIFITSVFLAVFLVLLRFKKILFLISGSIFSLLMYFIIDTSFWGLTSPPFGYVFFSRPIWFASLLISIYLFFIFNSSGRFFSKSKFTETEVITFILLIPCIILSISGSVFSTAWTAPPKLDKIC